MYATFKEFLSLGLLPIEHMQADPEFQGRVRGFIFHMNETECYKSCVP